MTTKPNVWSLIKNPVLNNNNKAAGQEVDHLHIHIIPRKNGDKIKLYNELNYSTLSLEEIHKLLEIK